MSSKIKPRQQRKPRNYDVVDAIINHNGGPMKNNKDKRKSNPRNSWKKENNV